MRLGSRLGATLPKGLYQRSLLIIILPIVLLQGVVASVFMERHWEGVTQRLSAAMAQDIAALVGFYEALPASERHARVSVLASSAFGFSVDFLPGELPPLLPERRFALLDHTLSRAIDLHVHRPFWLDTASRESDVEAQVLVDGEIMRVLARRNQAYASNAHIFLVWMVGASLILIAVAVLFLRNQIRPILQLADAAESLGLGRDVPDLRLRGAREVRRAAIAFQAMKRRIERQIEQRTTMLAGVSHDLRTVITRLKLQLALIGGGPEIEALGQDVEEMERMLQGYLAFARGDAEEPARPADIGALLDEVAGNAARSGLHVETAFSGAQEAVVRVDALKRALTNLVTNAARFAARVSIEGRRSEAELVILVDDNGPGIPADKREEVFRPFFRLDEARNQDHPGSGLGLAIARDVARSHGGDVSLERSPLGGLRAILTIPV